MRHWDCVEDITEIRPGFVGRVLRNHEGLVRGLLYRQFAALNPAKLELLHGKNDVHDVQSDLDAQQNHT